MNKFNELRANAAECRRMADATNNCADKRRWLKMAESWLRMIKPQQTAGERFATTARNSGTHRTKSNTSQ